MPAFFKKAQKHWFIYEYVFVSSDKSTYDQRLFPISFLLGLSSLNYIFKRQRIHTKMVSFKN